MKHLDAKLGHQTHTQTYACTHPHCYFKKAFTNTHGYSKLSFSIKVQRQSASLIVSNLVTLTQECRLASDFLADANTEYEKDRHPCTIQCKP